MGRRHPLSSLYRIASREWRVNRANWGHHRARGPDGWPQGTNTWGWPFGNMSTTYGNDEVEICRGCRREQAVITRRRKPMSRERRPQISACQPRQIDFCYGVLKRMGLNLAFQDHTLTYVTRDTFYHGCTPSLFTTLPASPSRLPSTTSLISSPPR